jgi:hypothetical protein
MRIISTIEDQEVIKSILNHLGLWIAESRPRAEAHAPPVREYVADGSCSTGFPGNTSSGDPCYSWDAIMFVNQNRYGSGPRFADIKDR